MGSSSNAAIVLGIFISLAFLTALSGGFTSQFMSLNCPDYTSPVWSVPESASSTGYTSATAGKQGFWGGDIPVSASTLNPSDYLKSNSYSKLCNESALQSGYLNLVIVAFSSIIIIYVVSHMLPFLGIGGE